MSSDAEAQSFKHISLTHVAWSSEKCLFRWEPWRLAAFTLHTALRCPWREDSWGSLSWELSPELAWRPQATLRDSVAPGLGGGFLANIKTSRTWRIQWEIYNKLTIAPSRETQDRVSTPGFKPQILQAWLDIFDTGTRLQAHWQGAPDDRWGAHLYAGETLPPLLRMTALGRGSTFVAWRYLAASLHKKGERFRWEGGVGWGSLDYARIRATFPFPWLNISYEFPDPVTAVTD